MTEAQKMVAELECHYHALGKALPDLKQAVTDHSGAALLTEVDRIFSEYGLK